MDPTYALISWLACATGGRDATSALEVGWAGHSWGSAPTADLEFRQQIRSVHWYADPDARRSARHVFCGRASRVAYGYRSGELVAVRWEWDGQHEELIEARVARVLVPPELDVVVRGDDGHSWAVANRKSP